MSFGDLLVIGATWALVIGAAWAVLIVSAAAVEVLSSGRLALTARLGCPAPARRALLAGLGIVLATHAVPRQRVEVQPGDSLWRLAREHSARSASEQDVARLVARTYRANRTIIGADPDLIRPGQRLHLPLQRQDTPHH